MKKTDNMSRQADTIIVLDFETTGLSPQYGDRAIEIGAVLIEEGEITGTFQRLMNPGFRINAFIESYTGITNAMIQKAAPCAEVISEFADFIGDHNLLAHNASFDKRFMDSEFNYIGKKYSGEFLCSLLISRRLYQDAPNHKLSGLVKYKEIPTDGVFHRALADSEMTAKLWLGMIDDIKDAYSISPVSMQLMKQLSRKSKREVDSFLRKHGGN